MTACYYNWVTDKEIPFESELPHCLSCLAARENEAYVGCCCVHQEEAEELGLTKA